jgi:hypothetical protein
LQERLRQLEADYQEKLAAISDSVEPQSVQLGEVELKPRRSDVVVRLVALAWLPEDTKSKPLWA